MTDAFWDETDDPKFTHDFNAGLFRWMEKNDSAFWEARLAETNPRLLLQWQAWRQAGRPEELSEPMNYFPKPKATGK